MDDSILIERYFNNLSDFIFLSHVPFSNNVILNFVYRNMGTYVDNMNKTLH